MKYMGSKARFAKDILPIILANRGPDQWYVEPFVGGGNIIDKVPGKRIGGDTNRYVAALLKAVSEGWVPPDTISEIEYAAIRLNPDYYDLALVGFAAIPCSYAAKMWGGYARGYTNKGVPRNYALEAKKHLLRQAPALNGIIFHHSSYDHLSIPPASLIYCDPPYAGTTGYKTPFDHDTFWIWCDTKVSEGHKVFVSEYNAPASWQCVWSKEVFSSLTKNTGSKRGIEKLFTK